MCHSHRTIAAALVATLALVGTSYATPARAKSQAKSHAVVGTLEKVDGQTITVQTPKGAETVMLMPTSRIRRGAETIQPANLSSYAGQRVKLRYVESKGEKHAQSVTLASASKAVSAKPAAKD
jgi:hypothetical protein